jgi:SET domain-containing protein
MILVPTSVRASARHGLGLYAEIAIPKGNLLWRFDATIDHRERNAPGLHWQRRSELLHWGYVNPSMPAMIVVCGDSSRFWNFSCVGEEPNAMISHWLYGGEHLIVASRDIAAGDELLIEPASDHDYARKMEHSSSRSSASLPFESL